MVIKDSSLRFNEECLQILDLDPAMCLTAARKGVKHKEFAWYLGVHHPRTIMEFFDYAERFMSIEEALGSKAEVQQGEKRKREDEGDSSSKYRQKILRKGVKHKEFAWYLRVHRPRTIMEFFDYAERFMSIKEALGSKAEVQQGEKRKKEDEGANSSKYRRKMNLTTRNPNVYFHFHRNIKHNTENCRNLHDKIEELIRYRYLTKYIQHESRESSDRQANQIREVPESSRRNDQPPRQQQPPKDKPIRRVINMITSGSIVVGCTTAVGKTSDRELKHEAKNPPKRPWVEEPIYFTEDDVRGIQYPHDDALIIKLEINDFEVKWVLVDSESSVDILFLEAFDKLHLQRSDMNPADSPLVGFSGKVARPLGQVAVPIIARTWPNSMRFKHTFLVVATPSPYNAILGRPILHALRAIVSTYLPIDEVPNKLRNGGSTR
ncbi:PREDICTED: uncharacterized protein LOC104611534 [Nelumbo nucifera]|uniref:Uncharacterized protein LOC104611534 n=1 Tax=Nelumbo nucifera TaxID=4432 RepID=A0A1U8BB05_NELNU|nr:PREDICTED: uncharacterized protein LOC104611534 [Nelumbo nucifera]